MRATVVIVTKVPGSVPVKTRLWPVLGERGARDLYVSMVTSTLRLAETFDVRPTLAFSPPDADPTTAIPGLGGCRLLPLRATDGAACLEEALAGAWDHRPLVAIGGTAPDLPSGRVAEALRSLASRQHDSAVVPTADGRIACLVVASPQPGLAQAFEHGRPDSVERVVAFLERRGRRPTVLAPWPDVDSIADLETYLKRTGASRLGGDRH